MMDTTQALGLIISGTEQVMRDNGFSIIRPDSAEKGAVPVTEDGDHTYLDFEGSKGKIRIEAFGNQLLLFFTDVPAAEATEEDLVKISANYFDPETFEPRDIKSLCNELTDSILSKFGAKAAAAGKNKKMPLPVSKSAAKSGALAYDGNTLANRLTAPYPELKEPYKANFEQYGEFLAEDFFVNHANKYIMETIRRNQKQEMHKLFKILNDIYENGSNETQSLVAVTILGEMNNDPALLAAAQEHMCDDLCETTLLVNKFMATGKGKKLRAKMENPPPYKPKKEKKPGMLSQMMSAGAAGGGQMPPM